MIIRHTANAFLVVLLCVTIIVCWKQVLDFVEVAIHDE